MKVTIYRDTLDDIEFNKSWTRNIGIYAAINRMILHPAADWVVEYEDGECRAVDTTRPFPEIKEWVSREWDGTSATM